MGGGGVGVGKGVCAGVGCRLWVVGVVVWSVDVVRRERSCREFGAAACRLVGSGGYPDHSRAHEMGPCKRWALACGLACGRALVASWS